ncbi:DNA and RNA helicase [Brevibacillus dissolubilis]|uniref:DNA and RNA helicase n=1 Tax=Brevibacillus dissolubilis TaxID=1844116 RepID=UPI0011171442|nr:DNA and RNA helicase [Brevibacillus dissolubilis]
MFSNRYPTFAKGRILKIEMLENLRDYPRNFIQLRYQDYSDGIISGAQVLVHRDHLSITSGIIKHAGQIYLLEADQQIPYRNTGKETVVKIRFYEAVEGNDFTTRDAELVLDEAVQVRPYERELGRFKLKEGSRLRSDYQNLADFTTEFNTLNLIHVEYAGLTSPTLAPAILRYFAGEMLRCGCSHPYDIAFAMQCLNQETVERDVILHYIGNRLGTGYRDMTHPQIHKYLVRILDEVKGGGRARLDARQGGPQRMIVE